MAPTGEVGLKGNNIGPPLSSNETSLGLKLLSGPGVCWTLHRCGDAASTEPESDPTNSQSLPKNEKREGERNRLSERGRAREGCWDRQPAARWRRDDRRRKRRRRVEAERHRGQRPAVRLRRAAAALRAIQPPRRPWLPLPPRRRQWIRYTSPRSVFGLIGHQMGK